MPIHVDYALTISELPQKCIHDCSQPGPVDEPVAYWREKLGFTVNRAKATYCLQGYGAWEREELDACTDEEIAEKVLWLACGDFAEFQRECERGRASDPGSGSDVFVLE